MTYQVVAKGLGFSGLFAAYFPPPPVVGEYASMPEAMAAIQSHSEADEIVPFEEAFDTGYKPSRRFPRHFVAMAKDRDGNPHPVQYVIKKVAS